MSKSKVPLCDCDTSSLKKVVNSLYSAKRIIAKRNKRVKGDLLPGGMVKRSIVKKAFDVLCNNDRADYAHMLTRVDELACHVSEWSPGARRAYRYLTSILRRKSGLSK